MKSINEITKKINNDKVINYLNSHSISNNLYNKNCEFKLFIPLNYKNNNIFYLLLNADKNYIYVSLVFKGSLFIGKPLKYKLISYTTNKIVFFMDNTNHYLTYTNKTLGDLLNNVN